MKNIRSPFLMGVLVVVLSLILTACSSGSVGGTLEDLLTLKENGSNVVILKTDDPTVTFQIGAKTYPVRYFSAYLAGTIVFMSPDGRQVAYVYPDQWNLAISINDGLPPVTVMEYPYLVVIGSDTIVLWNSSEAPLVPSAIAPTPFSFPPTQIPTPFPTLTPCPPELGCPAP